MNALQDGSRVKKSQPVSRLAFVLFKPVLHRFFGQLDNAQLRDRFGQFRRRLSVIYVAVRAANVLFSLTFRFHGSRFVEILAAIQRFLSQPFFVAEVFTGSPGKYVSLKDTIRGFKGIMEGEYDHLPEQAFYMVGSIEEAVEKAKKL